MCHINVLSFEYKYHHHDTELFLLHYYGTIVVDGILCWYVTCQIINYCVFLVLLNTFLLLVMSNIILCVIIALLLIF